MNIKIDGRVDDKTAEKLRNGLKTIAYKTETKRQKDTVLLQQFTQDIMDTKAAGASWQRISDMIFEMSGRKINKNFISKYFGSGYAEEEKGLTDAQLVKYEKQLETEESLQQ